MSSPEGLRGVPEEPVARGLGVEGSLRVPPEGEGGAPEEDPRAGTGPGGVSGASEGAGGGGRSEAEETEHTERSVGGGEGASLVQNEGREKLDLVTSYCNSGTT